MDILPENAQLVAGRLRIPELHGLEDVPDILPHGLRHRLLVLTVTCMNAQRGDAPGVLFFRGPAQRNFRSEAGTRPAPSMAKE